MSWQIDPAHTHVQFSVRHMMITKVRGEFEKFSGSVNLDETEPTNTTVNVDVETASVNTRDGQRDNHLRSADFFNSEEFPTMSFRSKRVERTGEMTAKLIGDLTIRDVTKEVALNVEYFGILKNPWGMQVAGFSATTRINRKDFGLVWNVALETGGMLVGEDVDISIEVELVKTPETETAAAA